MMMMMIVNVDLVEVTNTDFADPYHHVWNKTIRSFLLHGAPLVCNAGSAHGISQLHS